MHVPAFRCSQHTCLLPGAVNAPSCCRTQQGAGCQVCVHQTPPPPPPPQEARLAALERRSADAAARLRRAAAAAAGHCRRPASAGAVGPAPDWDHCQGSGWSYAPSSDAEDVEPRRPGRHVGPAGVGGGPCGRDAPLLLHYTARGRRPPLTRAFMPLNSNIPYAVLNPPDRRCPRPPPATPPLPPACLPLLLPQGRRPAAAALGVGRR
jgi:hypothetical protein